MVRKVEDRYYFVTCGPTSDKAKIRSKEDIWLAYVLELFLPRFTWSFELLRDTRTRGLSPYAVLIKFASRICRKYCLFNIDENARLSLQ